MKLEGASERFDFLSALQSICASVTPDADLLSACAEYCAAPSTAKTPNAELTTPQRLAKQARDVNALSEKILLAQAQPANAENALSKDKREQNRKDAKAQIEGLRRLLMVLASDVRVVILVLADRLAVLQEAAFLKQSPKAHFAQQTLDIFAPLANRLGVSQLKWELEDLAFRFAQPTTYKEIAKALESKRVEREAFVSNACEAISAGLTKLNLSGKVYGRPKHIYSIYNKMRSKNLPLNGLYDLRAIRITVNSIADCYAALGVVHDLWQPLPKEFDDYIARPKANGYKSLHTVVVAQDDKPVEIQIRTEAMHEFAEYGVAAHWRYKEKSTGQGDNKGQEDAIAWLRQLLSWQKDMVGQAQDAALDEKEWAAAQDEHIYCLSPQGRVVELPLGSTPIDFAYYLHSDLGHTCRGAKVNGQLVPLNTALASGQTVEIISEKNTADRHGVLKIIGPSRDWLNPQLGFLASPRSRAKVRAWFNAQAFEEALKSGREIIEKELARLGKTAVKLDDLAQKMGLANLDELCIAASKIDFVPRTIADALLTTDKQSSNADEATLQKIAGLAAKQERLDKTKGDVLIVGVDMLLTQLAKCCKPAPPDAIAGYVTRGKGVSIHRASCGNFLNLANKQPGRVIDSAWGKTAGGAASHYAADVRVIAIDRQGLLRDISDAFSRLKINVTAVNTQSSQGQAKMSFTVQIQNHALLAKALLEVANVKGVLEARRK